jgi:hypothetical protein
MEKIMPKLDTIYANDSEKTNIIYRKKSIQNKHHLWKRFCENRTTFMEMVLEYSAIPVKLTPLTGSCTDPEAVQYYLRKQQAIFEPYNTTLGNII